MKMGSRESSTRLLHLSQPLFAFPQRLLDLAALGDIDEGDDDAVDLVVDRPIGAQANVVPAVIAAADLPLDRGRDAPARFRRP